MEARETTPGPSREPSSPTPSKHLSSYFSLSLLFSLLLETERGSERGRDWSAGHQSTAAPCLNWAAVHLCGIISVQPAARRHYNIHRLPGRLLEGEPPFGGGIRGTKLPLQPRFFVVFFPRAACQLLPNDQFVGTAAFRLLYSVALSCFLATLSLFSFHNGLCFWWLSTHFRLRLETKASVWILSACSLAQCWSCPMRAKRLR